MPGTSSYLIEPPQSTSRFTTENWVLPEVYEAIVNALLSLSRTQRGDVPNDSDAHALLAQVKAHVHDDRPDIYGKFVSAIDDYRKGRSATITSDVLKV